MADLLNFVIAYLITTIPIYIWKEKKEKATNIKNIFYTLCWFIISILVTSLLVFLFKEKIVLNVIVPSCLGFSLFNYLVLEEKISTNFSKLFLIFIGFFFASTLQIIPIKLFNLNLKDLSIDTRVLLTLFSDFIFFLILLMIYSKDLKKDFKVFKKNYNAQLDVAFKYYFIGLIIMMASNLLINTLSPSSMASNEESVQSMIKASPYVTLICTGILAPVIEELVFRKAFRDAFQNKWLFITLSGIIFGGLHVILSISSIYDLLYLIPYCSLGISFGYIYIKSNNIFTSISLHALHNTILTIISIISYMVIL